MDFNEEKVNSKVFNYLFSDKERFEFIGKTSPDLGWTEAHINFVWDKKIRQTVGYIRTSSYSLEAI